MEDPKDRLTTSVSTAELERRWKAVREVMQEKKIDYLVMQNSEEYMGGMLRWFTDFTARHQFPMSVIFPLDDEMTTIVCGSDPPSEQAFPPEWAVRGIKKRLGGVYFPTFQYTSNLDAELAASVLKEKKNPTIGLVDRTFMPVTFYEGLVKELPGATFVDATEWVEEIKVPKSAEELDLIRGSAAIQDAAIEHLKKTIKPGMRDYEVYAEAHYFLARNGSERGLVLVNSGPLGTKVPFDVYRLQNRKIREGDQVSVLIEVNGPGGYYTEIMRIFVVGKPPTQELLDTYAVALEAQEKNAENLRPGVAPKDLWDMTCDFLEKNGSIRPFRLYAHGQGLSLVERPALRFNEPWKLKSGMNIAVHPYAVIGNAWTMVCDNYIIGDDGAERIHKNPREIISI